MQAESPIHAAPIQRGSRDQARRLQTIELLVRWLPEAINGAGGTLTDWIGSGPDSKHLSFGPLYLDAPRTWDALLHSMTALPGLERKHLWARYHGGHTSRTNIRFSTAGIPHLSERCELICTGPALKSGSGQILTDFSKPRWRDCTIHEWPQWVNTTTAHNALRTLSASMPQHITIPRALAA